MNKTRRVCLNGDFYMGEPGYRFFRLEEPKLPSVDTWDNLQQADTDKHKVLHQLISCVRLQ